MNRMKCLVLLIAALSSSIVQVAYADFNPAFCTEPVFDYNIDGYVDLADYSFLASCLSGPGDEIQKLDPRCHCLDDDRSSSLDLLDVQAFLACFDTDELADPACGNPLPEWVRADQKIKLFVRKIDVEPAYPMPGEWVVARAIMGNASRHFAESVRVDFQVNGITRDVDRVPFPPENELELTFGWNAEVGVNQIQVVLDSVGEWPDADPADNAETVDVLVSERPTPGGDLSITASSLISAPDSPDELLVMVHSEQSLAGTVPIELHQDGSLLDRQHIGPIAANETTVCRFRFRSSVSAQNRLFNVSVNPRFADEEVDTDNNVIHQDLRPNVDLSVEDLSVQRLADETSVRYSISWKVVNRGRNPVNQPFVTVLSVEDSIEPIVLHSQSYTTDGLAVGRTAYMSTVVEEEGSLRIAVATDVGNGVSESNEANNAVSETVSSGGFVASPNFGIWRSIGPSRINTGLGAVGRLHKWAVDTAGGEPGDPVTMYVGAPGAAAKILGGGSGNGGSGIWKSVDGGARWTPITDSLPHGSVGAIALDPTNSSIVYYVPLSGGMYRSADAGASWHRVYDPDLQPVSGAGGTLIVDPQDTNRLYLNTARGVELLVRSNGDLFTKSTLFALNTNESSSGFFMDAESASTLYTAVSVRPNGNTARAGIYRSTDSGVSWTKLTGCQNSLPTFSEPVRVRISQSGSKLYASFTSSQGVQIYFTNNITCQVGGAVPQDQWEAGALLTSTSIFGGLYADPNNPNIVFTSGVKFYRSIDGGRSFEQVPGPHDDHQGLFFDPWSSSTVYTLTDGGIYCSNQSGSPGSWYFRGQGISNVEIYDLATATTDQNYTIAGTQDNGTIRLTEQGTVWNHIKGGDGGTVAIDHANTDIMYAMHQYADQIVRFFDGSRHQPFSKNLPGDSSCFNLHYMIHPFDSETLLASCYSLWRTETTNAPGDWQSIFTPAPQDGNVCRSSVEADSNTYFAGTTRGRIFAGSGGESFDLLFTHPAGARVLDLDSDDHQPGRHFVCFGGRNRQRVYMLNRKGQSSYAAIDIDTNIPANLLVRCLAVDPLQVDTVYAGTSKGVYRGRSFDGGNDWYWEKYSQGLPESVAISDLEVQSAKGVIRASTYGRSAYEVSTGPAVGTDVVAVGQLTMLRVHDVAIGFGSGDNMLDGEVVFRLDSYPSMALGFKLRNNGDGPAGRAKLQSLLHAYVDNEPVRVVFNRSGVSVGEVTQIVHLP